MVFQIAEQGDVGEAPRAAATERETHASPIGDTAQARERACQRKSLRARRDERCGSTAIVRLGAGEVVRDPHHPP